MDLPHLLGLFIQFWNLFKDLVLTFKLKDLELFGAFEYKVFSLNLNVLVPPVYL